MLVGAVPAFFDLDEVTSDEATVRMPVSDTDCLSAGADLPDKTGSRANRARTFMRRAERSTNGRDNDDHS